MTTQLQSQNDKLRKRLNLEHAPNLRSRAMALIEHQAKETKARHIPNADRDIEFIIKGVLNLQTQ